MGFFSRNKKEEVPPPLITWASNAPAHWPKVITPPLPHSKPEGGPQEGVNSIFFLARLAKAFQPAGPNLVLHAVAQTHLAEAGLLRIPIQIKDNGATVPVWLFSEANGQSAEYFAGVRQIVGESGGADPVYFAPSPLPPAEPKIQLFPFHPEWFTKFDAAPEVDYAMWKKTEVCPDFTKSPDIEFIRRAYEASNGISTYVAAAILQHLEIIPQKTSRVELPEQPTRVPVSGPENQPILVSVSAQKGVQFHFHTQTSARYVSRLWKFFAEFCENIRAQIERANLRRDASTAPGDWWRFTEHCIRQNAENGEPSTAVGIVQWRSASGSSEK